MKLKHYLSEQRREETNYCSPLRLFAAVMEPVSCGVLNPPRLCLTRPFSGANFTNQPLHGKRLLKRYDKKLSIGLGKFRTGALMREISWCR